MGGSFCCQAEDGIRYLVRSRGLGDVYKRQPMQMVIHSGQKISADNLTKSETLFSKQRMVVLSLVDKRIVMEILMEIFTW